MLLEWLRICDRHGWLPGSARRITDKLKKVTTGVKKLIADLHDDRRKARLHLPYGPAAKALGLTGSGTAPPPSDR